ncbi:hypothetical protein HHI36_001192 [Cryptolaemus montrouzieri]|uniref:Uncharacterized protein n=1 Tax=Cryptolaemus montrouzieri TaxID=559131 RepID=A0ABD2P7L4_9CUCU
MSQYSNYFVLAYALSPAGPGYGATGGPGASPTHATGEPFAADSPYFPFSARPAPRLSPAKGAKGQHVQIRQAKEEPQQTLEQHWGVVTLTDFVILRPWNVELVIVVKLNGISQDYPRESNEIQDAIKRIPGLLKLS